MTAAHCFDSPLLNETGKIAILLGAENVNERNPDVHQFRFVKEIFKHEKYVRRKLIHLFVDKYKHTVLDALL